MTPSQYQSYVRQLESQRRRAIDKYNQDTRKYNQSVKNAVDSINREITQHNQQVRRQHQEQQRAIDNHNREVRQHNEQVRRQQQERLRAIDNHNREVRAHNTRVEANRRLIAQEFQKLQSRIATTPVFGRSTYSLNDAYTRLEDRYATHPSDEYLALDLPGRENANSLQLANALAGEPSESAVTEAELATNRIEDALKGISADLDQRWRGALFALNVKNPDAARHFCTSAREIFTDILDTKAPDPAVLNADVACDRTKEGRPTRRAKIQYILREKDLASTELTDFVDEDINNILDLFSFFNSATHGEAGKFNLHTLHAMKSRVEDGIMFLSKLVH